MSIEIHILDAVIRRSVAKIKKKFFQLVFFPLLCDENENTMIVFPNAKINIGLQVLRRRADGYHDLETVMMPVPWTDILEIVPRAPSVPKDPSCEADGDTLVCSGRPVDCPPEKNLVMKAVKALRRKADFPPVDIYLEKIIPDGAGLGGGSADAAFAITAVNELFGLKLDKRMMAETAATVGADCPFFIYNEPSLCTGTGTDIRQFPLHIPSPAWIAIVKPDSSVSTAEAYRGVTPDNSRRHLSEILSELPFEQWQTAVTNDFEVSVFPSHPAIQAVKEQLTAQGAAYVSMSGSGSAVFAIFLKDNLFKPLPDWNCYFYEQIR